MDNNQPIASNNQIINDFNVTVKVDPSTLPATQVSSDLEALKKAEDSLLGKKDITATLNNPTPKPVVNTRNDQPQELQALQLKNPFRGE